MNTNFQSSTLQAQGELYIGDSEGKIRQMIFEVTKTGIKDTAPTAWGAAMSSHGLGLLSLVAEPHEGVMVSIANDTCVKVWENASGANKKTLKSETRSRFNAVHVDPVNQDVFLVDERYACQKSL